MKRFAAALMIAGAGLMAGTAVVDAYPPVTPVITPDDVTPEPGGTFTVTVDGCLVGETVNFVFEDQTASDICAANGATAFLLGFVAAAPATGSASATFTAPTTPGVYVVTATFVTSNQTVNASITVEGATTTTVGGGLPATGSSSSGPVITIAVVLLAAGAGLYFVAQARRRRELTT